MYTAQYDFNKDLDQMLIDDFARYGHEIEPGTDSDMLRVRYFNFRRRLIEPVPRTVLLAGEFTCPNEYQQAVESIRAKLEAGEDVTMHMSTRITDPDYQDQLLNDWKIYHLHLSTNIGPKRFVDRTDLLLFLRIDPDTAYFINVMEHERWTEQQMVRVIHHNWPESVKQWKIEDIVGIDPIPTNDDVTKMRKHRLNYSLEVEPGAWYLPIGGGITSAGTSGAASEQMIQYIHAIRNTERALLANLQSIGEAVNKKTNRTETHLIFKLHIERSAFFAVEQTSNIHFKLFDDNL